MTNEEIVKHIQDGDSVTELMERLYKRNLPLINNYVKRYAAYEDSEDLLQEAYFGLYEAVKHYESSENVLFMSYAAYWIKQAIQRYIEKCGSIIRIPSYKRQLIIRYKKTVKDLEQELSRTPTDKEIADTMCLPVELLPELKLCAESVISIETPLSSDDGLMLCDIVASDFDLENDTIDKIYDQHVKSELWGIVERYTTDRENRIIKDYYFHNKTMSAIAKEQGMSFQNVRVIKEKGLQKLRLGKAKREILDKFEIVEANIYRTGMARFKNTGNSSVENIILLKELYGEEFQRKRKEIESSYNNMLLSLSVDKKDLDRTMVIC